MKGKKLIQSSMYVLVLPLFYKSAIMNPILNRITINPEICHGKPSIRNTRYTVELILDLLSSGMTNSEIIADYPALNEKDIYACLDFAARLTKVKSIHKID